MNPNHIDLPGTPIELEGEIIGYIDNKKEVMSEETVKYGLTATEIVKKEYPHIYAGYMAIMEEQLELFSRKHLDYGMHNITAGTSLATEDEREFALTGLWYRISDKIKIFINSTTLSFFLKKI